MNQRVRSESRLPEPEEDGEAESTLASESVRFAAHPARCPFCHTEVDLDRDSWLACSACLARHHAACWDESGRCGVCGIRVRLIVESPTHPAEPSVLRLGRVALYGQALVLTLCAAGVWLGPSAAPAAVAGTTLTGVMLTLIVAMGRPELSRPARRGLADGLALSLFSLQAGLGLILLLQIPASSPSPALGFLLALLAPASAWRAWRTG